MCPTGDNFIGDVVETPTDSTVIKINLAFLPKYLKEVEVRAKNGYYNDHKEVAIPSTRDKRISSDATLLLRNMALSNVYVSPEDNSIKTPNGEPYTIYVDYIPAEGMTLANIRTMDVRRVEIYDYPTDPRFYGSQHVINLIMVQYEYGGYTKVRGSQQFVMNNGNYGVYSKMAYKRMIFEAGLDYGYSKARNDGSDENILARFPSQTIGYDTENIQSLNRNDNVSAFFKAMYINGMTQISNTAGITYNNVPYSYNRIAERFSAGDYIPGISRSETTGDGLSASWNGNYVFGFGNNYMLTLMPSASYGKFTNRYSYTSEDAAADERVTINNNATEHVWNASLDMELFKNFGRHSGRVGLWVSNKGDRIDYTGTSNYLSNYREHNGMVQLSTALNFGRAMFMPSVSLGLFHHRYDGVKVTEVVPRAFISFMYSINDRSHLVAHEQFYNMVTPVSESTPVVQFQNQIMAYAGNPDLKSSLHNQVGIDYSYNLFSNLSFTLSGSYNYDARLMSFVMTPVDVDGREYILRHAINSGNTNRWTYGVSASYSPIDNLSMRAAVKFVTTNIHSPVRYKDTDIAYNAAASYSFGNNMFVSAYYQSKDKYGHNNYIVETGHFYGFTLGWGNGNLHISAEAMNPFTTSSKYRTVCIPQQFYDSYRTVYNERSRYHFALNVAYSFSYGKRLNRDQESGNPSGASSGIIK